MPKPESYKWYIHYILTITLADRRDQLKRKRNFVMPDLTTFLLPGLFFGCIGLLSGYVLWFRDRSELDSAQKELDLENSQLRLQLDEHEQQTESFNARHQKQDDKLQILQELCDDLATGREKTTLERKELEAELNAQRNQVGELSRQLMAESSRRVELEDKIHALQHESHETCGNLENKRREEKAKFDSVLAQRTSEFEQLSINNDRTTDRLHQAEATIAQLKSELGDQQQLLITAKNNASGLEKEYVSLETSLKSHSEMLSESRGETAAAASAKILAEERLSDLRSQNELQKSQITAFQEVSAHSVTLEKRCSALEQSLVNNRERLTTVTNERDIAMNAEKEGVRVIAGLQSQISNQESMIRMFREKLEEYRLQFKNEMDHKDDLESSVAELQKQLETRNLEFVNEKTGYTSRLDDAERCLAETEQCLADAEVRLHETETRLAITERQLCEAQAQFASSHESWEHQTRESVRLNEDRMKEWQSRFETLTSERDDALNRVETVTTQLLADSESRVTKIMAQHDATVVQLKESNQRVIAELHERIRATCEDRDAVLADTEATNNRIQAEAKSRFDALLIQRDDALTQTESFLNTIRQLKNRAAAGEKTIRNLRRERGQVLLRSRQKNDDYPRILSGSFEQTVTTETAVSSTDDVASSSTEFDYGGETEIDPVRGEIYIQTPKHRDDLKRISGIAEVLERKLNDCGIYTYRQIMNWDPTAIKEFSKLLIFKDRIERDDWQGQAQFFYVRERQQSSRAA